jgi:uncharacterized phiE125 gp8 family phage protein
VILKPVRTAAPAADLMTLAEAKKHCRVDHSEEDDVIAGLLAAATAWLDGYSGVLGRALINQTWRLNLSCWPACRIRLPLAPVSAITSIKYYNTANVQQTLGSSNYGLIEDALSPSAEWVFNASLPSLYERPDAIEVIFVAGYGPAASDVPQAVIVAAKMLIAHLYENREPVNIGNITTNLPFAVDALIAPFRRVGV